MNYSDCLSTNSMGHLTIGGVDTIELAKQFGTPCYVFDENKIRENCRSYTRSMKENYSGNGRVIYASKAFNCIQMCKLISSEGLGLDCVSGGEIFTALTAGFPADKIYFHGNNKTLDELKIAVENGVGRIIVDNFYELENLDRIAREAGKSADIILRVKPGINADTHEFILTGQIDSKFGLDLESGEAMKAVKAALKADNITLHGLHCHIGSQIFDVYPFEEAAKVMCGFIAQVKAETGYECEELDLGGGFGIRYIQSDDPPALDTYMKGISAALLSTCAEYGIKAPFVIIEPGRSIAGSAGITLYTAGAIKHIPNVRTYVSIDGGMGDNPRYILYGSSYEIVNAVKADKPKDTVITLAGRCCESGDLIQKDAPIQEVEAGDIIAVLATGAYNFSMSSNYNRITRPPVVFVKDGTARLAVKRQSYEELIIDDVR